MYHNVAFAQGSLLSGRAIARVKLPRRVQPITQTGYTRRDLLTSCNQRMRPPPAGQRWSSAQAPRRERVSLQHTTSHTSTLSRGLPFAIFGGVTVRTPSLERGRSSSRCSPSRPCSSHLPPGVGSATGKPCNEGARTDRTENWNLAIFLDVFPRAGWGGCAPPRLGSAGARRLAGGGRRALHSARHGARPVRRHRACQRDCGPSR